MKTQTKTNPKPDQHLKKEKNETLRKLCLSFVQKIILSESKSLRFHSQKELRDLIKYLMDHYYPYLLNYYDESRFIVDDHYDFYRDFDNYVYERLGERKN